jgi:acetolactate synthase-1/2/3 large subunit
LLEHHVDTIFGYPGGAVLPVYDALFDCSEIRHILVRHKQAAVHAADGYARATGRPGVALVTSGPGATNAVTGFATAYMDSVPLIVLTGQVPTEMIRLDSFQEVDVFGMTMPVTKHNDIVMDSADLPRIVREAFYQKAWPFLHPVHDWLSPTS